jgi:hypothetical protein
VFSRAPASTVYMAIKMICHVSKAFDCSQNSDRHWLNLDPAHRERAQRAAETYSTARGNSGLRQRGRPSRERGCPAAPAQQRGDCGPGAIGRPSSSWPGACSRGGDSCAGHIQVICLYSRGNITGRAAPGARRRCPRAQYNRLLGTADGRAWLG